MLLVRALATAITAITETPGLITLAEGVATEVQPAPA